VVPLMMAIEPQVTPIMAQFVAGKMQVATILPGGGVVAMGHVASHFGANVPYLGMIGVHFGAIAVDFGRVRGSCCRNQSNGGKRGDDELAHRKSPSFAGDRHTRWMPLPT